MNRPADNYKICIAQSAMTNALANINYTAWKETYAGIIHDSYLDTLSPETYVKRWEHIMLNRNQHSFILVAQTRAGDIAGYCMGGRIMKPYKHFEAEIYALYLLREHHGQGIGGMLFVEALKRIQQMNYNSVCLFVLQSNPTIAFYKHYNPDFEELSKVSIGGQKYDDIALGWSNLSELL